MHMLEISEKGIKIAIINVLVLQWKTDNMQDVQFQLRDGVVRMNQIEMLDIKSSIADEECL